MNPYCHEYKSSLRRSGFIVLVLSTILLRSLLEVSLLTSFHLAFASNNVFNAVSLLLSRADSTSVLNSGLTPRLISPFLTIFTLSRDWSILFFNCVAVSAECSRCSLFKRSDSIKNESLRILNSVFGGRPKCASNGEHCIVFCLIHRRSRIIVLSANLLMLHFRRIT